jgi:ATP-dependent DNA helicase PIF1
MLHLSAKQSYALDLMKSGQNVFLTGGAGTGKSFVLRKFLSENPEVPALASTGAAAILIGGRTLHSFFGLGILEGGFQKTCERALKNPKVVRRIKKAKAVVIDEVSMLSGATLRAAEGIARLARNSKAPWGGLQIIACGDFAQLPPVTRMGENTDWAFLDEIWALSGFQSILLDEVHRTKEEDFLKILQCIREGDVTEEVKKFLNSRVLDLSEDFTGTRLFPHRATAEEFNLKRLAELEGEVVALPTEYMGEERAKENLRKQAPVPEILHLKQGALVMIRKNDVDGAYVNGSMGHVRSIGKEKITVDLVDGGEAILKPMLFEILDGDGNILASARNFPLSLAYASTIHKAQGATLDRLVVDLSKLWEAGQAYVALSRVKESQHLYIQSWRPNSIRQDPAVREFYANIE